MESTAVSLRTRRTTPHERQATFSANDGLEEVLVEQPLASPPDLSERPGRAPRVTGPPPPPLPLRRVERARPVPPRPRTATEQFQSLPPAEAVIVARPQSGLWARGAHLVLAAVVGLALGVGGGLFAISALRHDEGQKALPPAAMPKADVQPQVVALAPKVRASASARGPANIVATLARAEHDLRRIRWLSTTDREQMLRLRLHVERQQWQEAALADRRLPKYLRRLSIACVWRAEVAAARGEHAKAAELLAEVAGRRALSRHVRVQALIALSQAHLARGTLEPAREAAERAVSWARRSRNATLEAAAGAQLGRCLRR